MLTSETFINCLEYLFPCTGLIYVGAGNGSALNGEHFSRISRLLAIEADDLAFSYLENNLQNRTGWTALKALVGKDEAKTSFFAASNPNESGLLNPEALKSVWRNLTCLGSRPQASTTLSSVLRNECQAEHYNWLRIDCLPPASILRGIEKHLEQFDVIDVRVLDHAAGILEDGCTKPECDTLLIPLGYQMGFVEEATNPMVHRVLYVRDGRACLSIQAEQIRRESQIQIEHLTKDKGEAEKLAAERVALLEALPIPVLSSAIQNLAEKMEKQGTDLIKLRKHLESTMKQEMLNSTQQLEAFLNIQNFFNHGEYLKAMHGWPVSPDFALYLIDLLERNDYDLILEFGSGTSTVIMAKAIARLNRKSRGKPAVVQAAFEHLKKYHDQTLANLQSSGVADAVQLILAPLQPYQAANGNTYSYYACHEKLAELAESLKTSSIKMLIVVDGPPGSIGKHARYPALPAVLAHFKSKNIDIVLDDYFRDDEKEVGKLWENDLDLTGFQVQTETVKMEKDAFFISAHPN